jgi:hypothetical protein
MKIKGLIVPCQHIPGLPLFCVCIRLCIRVCACVLLVRYNRGAWVGADSVRACVCVRVCACARDFFCQAADSLV